ncbi:invasion associated locus B family protein [Bosea vestrisii]|uniref:invasion associated locus B family protein n=1 Tax=Bosea vestrisii TaxID=151416 RepID=UPI0024E00448|nr:invasion associated locus B family protein [Bosea vestrisii]WID98500.1 invasion associated locus B family protein [Bosea vestrisii]
MSRPTILAFSMSVLAAGAALAQAPAQRPAPQRPAQAQTAPAPAQTAPAPGAVSQPDNTTATYGDWVMRCQASVAARVCEIVQTLEQQGQRGPIALVAIGRPVKDEPIKLVIQVPPNLSLGDKASVRVTVADKDEALAVFQRCLPGGCFAEASLSDEVFKRWRGFGEAGQMRYLDAAKREVALPLSFRGFPAAAEALQREP